MDIDRDEVGEYGMQDDDALVRGEGVVQGYFNSFTSSSLRGLHGVGCKGLGSRVSQGGVGGGK